MRDELGFSPAVDLIFYKVLAHNDDSGRHGVVVPIPAYDFINAGRRFPANPRKNDRAKFELLWPSRRTLGSFLYYERYPECRLGALAEPLLNERDRLRLLVVGRQTTGGYEARLFLSETPGFPGACSQLGILRAEPGTYGLLRLGAERPEAQSLSSAAQRLLAEFDRIKDRGFVSALSDQPHAIGETFESLVGISRNNSRAADYDGVEIKVSLLGVRGAQPADEDLFLCAPEWADGWSAKRMVTDLGYNDEAGRRALLQRVHDGE